VLHCSSYNQGCDGGFPYAVNLFGNEIELVFEDCYKVVQLRRKSSAKENAKFQE
jgi:hypothetical protein